MPTYRVAPNTYAIQHIGAYGTGPARNLAGFIGIDGHLKQPPRFNNTLLRPQAIRRDMGPISLLNPDLIVPATAVDTPVVVQLLEEFQVQVAGTVVELIEPERIGRRFSNWPHVQAVDARHGVYCELTVHEDEAEAEFTAAFPRGASVAFIGPVFAECGRHAVVELASRQPGVDTSGWRVWGEFLHGQDANQLPDGGLSIAETLAAWFATKSKTVTIEIHGGLAIPSMALGDLADVF